MDMKLDSILVKRLRQDRSMSQEELAAAAGLSSRTVQRIERDGAASLESAKAMASVLEVSVSELTDSGAEISEELVALNRGIRWGIGGVLTGGWLAILGIGYGVFFEGAPAMEAGVASGIIGTAMGAVCALIGIGSEWYRCRNVGDAA